MTDCRSFKINVLRGLTVVFLSVFLATPDAASLQKTARPDKPAAVPEVRAGLLIGYLDLKTVPNSLKLIPAAPESDSAIFALDQAVSRSLLKLRGSARWDLAKMDADLKFPEAAGTFSCALNAPITEAETPYLYQLLRRIIMDAAFPTYRAKNEYERVRPYMQNNEATCTPEEESRLRDSGSYPSGHTAIGWAWAMILSEIAPDRVDQIMARGRAFGESRMVCNLHWNSDVNEGRTVAAAVVAQLHSNPGFLYDLAAAKEEIAAVRAKNLPPTRDCQAEAAALAVQPE